MRSLITLVILLISTISFADTTSTDTNADSNKYLEPVDHLDALVKKDAKDVNDAFEKLSTETGFINDVLDKMNISVSANTSLKILSGFGIGVGGTYHVAPSYIGNYYTRMDGYKLSANLNPLQWFLDKNTPWILHMEPGVEMQFWQFFPTGEEARDPRNGYGPWHFPFSAEKAEKNLKPGDMAHTRVYLNLNAGAKGSVDFLTALQARGSITYVIQGMFDVFVFRAEQNKIRLRLVAHRNRDTDVEGSVGLQSDYSILGVKIVDNAVVDILRLDKILAFKTQDGSQNIFLADYTLNLDYPEVRAAYDELFTKALRFKAPGDSPLIQTANPFNSRTDVHNMLVSNLTKLDDIFREDLDQKDHGARRVDRNFAGSDGSDNSQFRQFQFGISGIFRVDNYSVRRDNQMELRTMKPDGSEDIGHFYLPTWTKSHETKALLDTINENTFQSSNIIYKTDDKYVPVSFESMAFYYDYTDKTLRGSEQTTMIERFQEVLPANVFADFTTFLKKHNLYDLNDSINNVRISSRYFLNNVGLKSLQNQFADKSTKEARTLMRSSIVSYLSTVSLSRKTAPPGNGKNVGSNLPPPCADSGYYSNKPTNIRSYCKEIDEVAGRLATVVNPYYPALERNAQIDDLTRNPIYMAYSAGIIFHLVPQSNLPGSSYFEIKYYLPGDVQPVRFVYPESGDYPDREYQETLLDIQKLMDNVIPDMRLEGDHDDLTTRHTGGGADSPFDPNEH